jgi:DNA-binding GntR family transcriptional regulator
VSNSSDNAYHDLRAAILGLELMPGERLSERGLEALLGASRTPIRAALMRLENEGLAQRAGHGWRVAPIDLTELRNVMEYRVVLESATVAAAMSRAAPGELAALRALLDETLIDTGESGLRRGESFHLALAHLSRNPFFVDGIRDALTRLSRTRWLEVRSPDARAVVQAEHAAIVDAMLAGDEPGAVTLMAAHNHGTRERLLALLTEQRRQLRGRGISIIESSCDHAGVSVQSGN